MFPVNSNSVANAMQETNKIYPQRWYVARDQIRDVSVVAPIPVDSSSSATSKRVFGWS